MFYINFSENLANANLTPIVPMKSPATNRAILGYQFDLPKSHRCPREISCKGSLYSSCVVGHEGPLCEVCSDGYYKLFKACVECPTKKWMIVQLSVLAAIILIIIVIVVWTDKKRKKKRGERSSGDMILARLKVVVGCYQVTAGMIEGFSFVRWPDSVALVGKYSGIIQMSVFEIAPIQCLFPHIKVNAFGNLYAMLAMNASAIIVAFAVYALRKLMLTIKTLPKEQKLKKDAEAKELVYRNLFFFLFMTYLSTCTKTASVLPLACRKICDDEKEQFCNTFLKADYTIKCTTREFRRSVIVAFCAIGYVLFLPFASSVVMCRLWLPVYKNRHNEGEIKTPIPEEKSKEVVGGLRFLYESYRAKVWFWELVETFRKVALTSGLILVGREGRNDIAMIGMLLSMHGTYITFKLPMVDVFENKLLILSVAVSFFNLAIAGLCRIPNEGLPYQVDVYMEHFIFKTLVFGANSVLIARLVGKKLIYFTQKNRAQLALREHQDRRVRLLYMPYILLF